MKGFFRRPGFQDVAQRPGRELPSQEWVQSREQSGARAPRLVTVDLPYRASFPPASFLDEHPTLRERNWPSAEIDLPATFLLTLPFGRTIGARGSVIGSDNVLISDLSMRESYDDPAHFLLTQPDLEIRKMRHLKGRYALLSCYGTTTYHWMYDCLPRVELLRRAGCDLEAFDGFLLRKPKYPAHYKTLELLGIPKEKIVWCTQNSHYGCDELVVPSFTTDQAFHTERNHHPWVLPFLRNLVPSLQAKSGAKRRLLINREDSQSTARQIVNQRELAALLGAYGFEEVTLGTLDFEEQAHLFASAEFIVAAHGGGLSNLCFCDPSTKLLELFAPDYVCTHFRNIARSCGIEYQPLVMDSVHNPNDPKFGGNIRADLAKVEAVVKTMCASTAACDT